MNIPTPYYLIDEHKLLNNLKIIKQIKDCSGANFVLALKCFSTWSVFGLISRYLDGITSSSPYEVRLGYEQFGKEVHAYSVGFSRQDIESIKPYADKVIFNSLSQLKRFARFVRGKEIGLRVNPGVSYSPYDLANPCRRYSRLGVVDQKALAQVIPQLNGLMFHFNCENNNFSNFSAQLDHIADVYGNLLHQIDWISLGGGIFFTQPGYPIKQLCEKIKKFREKFSLQIYFEPGEAVVTNCAQLVTRIIDIVHNEIDIAIVDVSLEAHLLDLLIYHHDAKIKNNNHNRYKYMVAGRSCLAGDVLGTYYFPNRLKIGGIIRFEDTAGYSMVKKNWFNGIAMPSIVVKRLNGKQELIKKFTYTDFKNALS